MRIFYATIILLLSFNTGAFSQDKTPMPSSPQNPSERIIRFYPNPAISVINFDFQRDYDKTYTFQIFNFLGKKVFEINNVSPKTKVDLANYYRGIYIFQLRDRNGKVIDSGKFQVAK